MTVKPKKARRNSPGLNDYRAVGIASDHLAIRLTVLVVPSANVTFFKYRPLTGAAIRRPERSKYFTLSTAPLSVVTPLIEFSGFSAQTILDLCDSPPPV